MKRWIKTAAGSIVAGLLTVAVFPFFRDTVSHSLRLQRMTKSFASLEHPHGTAHVRTLTAVGLLAGNGNHCDYFVGEMRFFTGSPDSIRTWYADKRIIGPAGSQHDLTLLFITNRVFVGDNAAWNLPFSCGQPSAWVGTNEFKGRDHYIVTCFLVGFDDPGWDMRCH